MGRIDLSVKDDAERLTAEERERVKQVLLSRVASRFSGLLAGRKTLMVAVASIASGLGLNFGAEVNDVSPTLEAALTNSPTGVLQGLLGAGLMTIRSGIAKGQKETDAKLEALAKKIGVEDA